MLTTNYSPRQNIEKIVLWIGPHFNSKGGVASVIKIFKDEGFFESGHNKFIPTMADGSKLSKLLLFFKALHLFLLNIRRTKLVHVHLCCNASFWRKSIFILIASYFRVPVITHLHDSGFPSYYTSAPYLQKRFIEMVLAKSNHVFVLSHENQNFLSKLPLKTHPQLFPNPVVLKTSKTTSRETGTTILFLGRIILEKGIQELFEAVAIVKEQFPAIQLIICGDGDINLLHRLVGMYKLQDNTAVKGWVVDGEREALMQKSTVLVLPSYGEGQSMAILEAMECYVPVISTIVGGNTFLIDNGVSGLLVPPRNSEALAAAILLILKNPALKEKLVAAARRKVEDLFDSKKILHKVRDLYSYY